MDRTARVNLGQRAYAFVLHALAYWPTFRGHTPESEDAAAALLGVPVGTLQRLKEGELGSLPDLNRRLRRRIGALSVGQGADVVDYYLPAKLSQVDETVEKDGPSA
jgi:hypothetical protein